MRINFNTSHAPKIPYNFLFELNLFILIHIDVTLQFQNITHVFVEINYMYSICNGEKIEMKQGD